MPEPKTETDDSIPAIGYTCFRCNRPGHGWTECKRPPAKDQQELENRIADILIRWDIGYGFKTWIKTRIIELERNAFKPKKGKAA